MPQIKITSLEDPRIAPFRMLKESNATRREGLFICEGEKLSRRLIESRCEVVSLLVAERMAELFADVDEAIPRYVVPEQWVEQIIGFNFHRGVLACGRRPARVTVSKIAERCGERATLVVCPDVQDPENLGSIIRIAAAFGCDGVLLGQKTADPFSRRVLRTSMGSVLRTPIAESDDLSTDLAELTQQHHFNCWATVLDNDASPLGAIARPGRLAILFGSEGHGLDRSLVERCQHRVTIPIAEGTDSLNVAIAAGIFLHALSSSTA